MIAYCTVVFDELGKAQSAFVPLPIARVPRSKRRIYQCAVISSPIPRSHSSLPFRLKVVSRLKEMSGAFFRCRMHAPADAVLPRFAGVTVFQSGSCGEAVAKRWKAVGGSGDPTVLRIADGRSGNCRRSEQIIISSAGSPSARFMTQTEPKPAAARRIRIIAD